MHGAKAVDPGGRSAAPADCGDQLGEHIEAVLKPAMGFGLQDAKQLGVAQALDDVIGNAPGHLGLLRTRASDFGNGTGTR
jgi:hypothetical protein